ncbi:MAG: glycosyltransferase [Bacteroidaceae bacterium]|nr:glycosyltransferase [Bacteroidaceae bacterium]
MNQKDIILSIIIPVYNVEDYLEECLNSIVKCMDKSYEIIIINDGTPDNSMDIAFRYKELYNEKIRIFNQNNQGLSITRNNGINKAYGKYIWFIDSDDYLKENSIETILNILKENINIDLLSMPLNFCYENGKEEVEFTFERTKIISNYEYLNNHLPYGASTRFIIKREIVLNNQLYFIPHILHEDGEFGLRLIYYTENICILDKPLYNYRIRSSGSIMSSWKRKNSEDLIFTYDSLSSLFNENPLNRNIRSYKEALFNILLPSVLFAKNKWNCKEFINFYKDKKKDIKYKTKAIIPFCSFTYRLKTILFYISPINYCKFKVLISNVFS